MSRMIDADALEELFCEVISGIAKRPDMNGSMEHMIRASAMVIEMIKDAPTIEPQRKKGKWILVKGSNGKDYHKCSECLHTQEITGVKNYCAVCGAEMREPEDIPMEYFESGGR